jgi:nitrogen fixation protein FixH
MSIIKSGKLWPYGVGIAITLVFFMGVGTVIITGQANIQPSDDYMTNYQDADKNANTLIKAKLAFNQKYNVVFLTKSLGGDKPVIKYKITDKEGHPINDAKIIIAISRPETSQYNFTLDTPKVENGIYSFTTHKLPKVGLWNIVAKIQIGEDYKFLNIKADTRIKKVSKS